MLGCRSHSETREAVTVRPYEALSIRHVIPSGVGGVVMAVAQRLASARSFTCSAVTAGAAGRVRHSHRHALATRVIALLG
jgi:hypothetical protein